MGTPEFFKLIALENIVKAGHDVVGVITQPDKPKGRGGKNAIHTGKRKSIGIRT